jgi:hypothetical protein
MVILLYKYNSKICENIFKLSNKISIITLFINLFKTKYIKTLLFILLLFILQKSFSQNTVVSDIFEASKFCGFSKDSLVNYFGDYEAGIESLGCGNEILMFLDKKTFMPINNLTFLIEWRKCLVVELYDEVCDENFAFYLTELENIFLENKFEKISEKEWYFIYKEQKKRLRILKYGNSVSINIVNKY